MTKQAFNHLYKLAQYKKAETNPREKELIKAILIATGIGGLAGGTINAIDAKPRYRLGRFLQGALISGGLSGAATAAANHDMFI